MSRKPVILPIAERVVRFRTFYQRKNDRPLLGFFVGSDYPLHRYEAAKTLPADVPLTPEHFAIEPYLDDCDRLFDLHEACGGDFIWSASAFWGIPWLEAALGCPILADHTTGSIYSEPPRDFTGPDDLPAFDPDSPWMQLAVEFIRRMAERSDGRWPIGTTRMRGISDLLSALYGGTNSIMAMLDSPDEAHEACRRLTDFWIAFGQLQLDHIPLYHEGIGSFYYNMWAPAGTVWHQEDAAALLSPRLYDTFIRACDLRIVESFDACIMHQHPTKFVPTTFYLEMPFKALELHIDRGGPTAEELFEKHWRTLERMPLLIWGSLSTADLDWIFSRLSKRGLAVMAVVDGSEQAADVWHTYVPA